HRGAPARAREAAARQPKGMGVLHVDRRVLSAPRCPLGDEREKRGDARSPVRRAPEQLREGREGAAVSRGAASRGADDRERDAQHGNAQHGHLEEPIPRRNDEETLAEDTSAEHTTMTIRIERATERDLPLILHMIRDLAEYERSAADVIATEAGLREALFAPRPDAEVIIAYADAEPAGFALFFHNFSTFLGRRGLYLEDLFVKPAFRGHGIGKRLLVELARLAVPRATAPVTRGLSH